MFDNDQFSNEYTNCKLPYNFKYFQGSNKKKMSPDKSHKQAHSFNYRLEMSFSPKSKVCRKLLKKYHRYR